MQGVIQLVASYIFGHHIFKYSKTLMILKNTILNKKWNFIFMFAQCLHNTSNFISQ